MCNSGRFLHTGVECFGAFAEQYGASPMSCSSPGLNSKGTTSLALFEKSTCPVKSRRSHVENDADDIMFEQESSSRPSSEYLRQLYTGTTPGATVRSSLVDWMVQVAQKLCLSNDTTFLAVQLLDRYMQRVLELQETAQGSPFARINQLQLTGITVLWVAAKFEGGVVPSASAFLQQLPASMHYMRRQLLAAEQKLLMALDYRLTCPTPKSFLRRCMSSLHEAQKLHRRTYFTASYLAELSLLDAGMLCFKPSEVAASSYAWALQLNDQTSNEDDFQQHTGYSLAQIASCLQRLALVHTAACNTSRPCMISVKYLAKELEQVAALPPVDQNHPSAMQPVPCTLSGRASSTDLNNIA